MAPMQQATSVDRAAARGVRPQSSRLRRRAVVSLVAAATLVTGGVLAARPAQAVTKVGTALNFQLVGHDPLFGRGENSALALFDHYVYVGSRSDGTHLHSGIAVVDVADPSHPKDVGEIPLTPKLTLGYTSRELRVWPQQQVLVVMYFGCSAIIHACASAADTGEQPMRQFDFFDLSGSHARHPVLISTYNPSTVPHEMFLWVDPVRSDRALLYWTSPNNSAEHLVVTDLSGWRTGVFKEVAYFSAIAGFTADQQNQFDVRLHSMSVSSDGTRGYLAYYGGGVLIIDTSDLANALPKPVIREITPVSGRAFWDVESAHSTVAVPGTNYLLSTEEIYGKGVELSAAFGATFHGCPWGWMRIIDASNPAQLKVVSEYRIAENQPSYCKHVSALQNNLSSFTSHNPTVLHDLAFITWHSGGLQAVDLTDPTHPAQAGYFIPKPDPLTVNHTPDPALELGSNGVIAWSYPIIKDGLIYFIDIRNGLYIVRYSGPHATEVAGISFFEGNSNVGDAGRLATLAVATRPLVGAAAGGANVASLPDTAAAGAGAGLGLLGLGTALGVLRVRRSRRRRARP